jgi:hypothetical protein
MQIVPTLNKLPSDERYVHVQIIPRLSASTVQLKYSLLWLLPLLSLPWLQHSLVFIV